MCKPIYMLCASAYTAGDYSKFGLFRDRCYQWGYFPEVKFYDLDELFAYKRQNEKTSLIWVGRLIGWKHPECAVLLAERLKEDGYDFVLRLVGGGEMETQLRAMISQKNLENYVHILGEMTPEAVRSQMEQADIFLCTSDFNEGWGAVLNEGMNSACAVVASHAVGSVPFLLRDGENGYIYQNGSMEDLYHKTVRLIEDSGLRERLGRKAHDTITGLWNAETAAERFLKLAEALMNGESTALYEEGPCSKACNLENNWYHGGA